jgi:hypothetical protein
MLTPCAVYIDSEPIRFWTVEAAVAWITKRITPKDGNWPIYGRDLERIGHCYAAKDGYVYYSPVREQETGT